MICSSRLRLHSRPCQHWIVQTSQDIYVGKTELCVGWSSAADLCASFQTVLCHELEHLHAYAVYHKAFEEAVERLKSLNGELVEINFTPFSETAQLLYSSAFVAERYAGIRDFIDSKVSIPSQFHTHMESRR